MKESPNQRLFLAIAIWLACFLALSTIFPDLFGGKKAPPHPAQPTSAEGSPPAAPASPSAATPSPPAGPPQAQVPRETSPRPPIRTATFETPRARIVVTSEGAALQSVQLLGEKFTRHRGTKEESQVDLAGAHAGEPLPFSTELRAANGAAILPRDAPYQLVQEEARRATFRAAAGGLTVSKTFSVDEQTYRIDLQVDVRAAAPLAGTFLVDFGAQSEEVGGSFFSPRSTTPARTICMAGNKVERTAVGQKNPAWDGAGAAFAGIDQQYFLIAVTPPPGVTAGCHIEAQGQKAGSLLARLSVPVSVAAGSSVQLPFVGYAGPKDTDELAAVSKSLRQAVDLGFWAVIADILLGIMKFFHKVVPPHNWGISIILLTVAMKVLTFPLQHKSMKSMQEMQRIQPQLEEMKKKYAGDTQRQNLEQMKLFKEHGVNPMGSCLPMLIQMPIWFALYTTLQVSVELYNAPFIRGWLDDLTAPDPYYILPVAMGITMILTQVLTPAPMSNPSQKTMGYVMSGFFSLLMLTLPSGLTLYIFTNNILSIAQQMYLRRAIRPPPAGGQTIEMKKKGEGPRDAARAKLPV
ncbi:MAG: membrane protein insertase YidC [Deltaproteobacteria bacterium]|nr:MAG: membrane protein insertase YidC [Deltaproteobacteria bacterium]